MQEKKSPLREWIEAVVIAALLATFVRTFFFQIYKIPTTSMVPTLMPGDKIFVSKLTYGPKIPFTNIRIPGFREPKRADIIVFIPPHEKKKFFLKRKRYVKRLIGAEGDRIVIKEGNVYINDQIVVDARIARNYYYNHGEWGQKETIVVPEGKYFFLGDNSASSLDSRFWGFVNESDIIGKAVFIWWPPKRLGVIE